MILFTRLGPDNIGRAHWRRIKMGMVVRGARLIDSVGLMPIEDGAVLISEGRIAKVGRFAELDPPAAARLIDLPNHTLAPGFIDVHSHATIETSGNEYAHADRREAEVALWAAHYLGIDLRAGVTTMRTLGDRKLSISCFDNSRERAWWKTPKLQAAGHLLQSSLVNVSVTDATADDIDFLRAYIRQTARAGADWIKFYATPNSSAPDPTLATYSKPEVDAIFFEARRINKPVSVHCHGGEAADSCIDHRVDSLEHGLYLDDAQFAAMARTTSRWCRRRASFSSNPTRELRRASSRARRERNPSSPGSSSRGALRSRHGCSAWRVGLRTAAYDRVWVEPDGGDQRPQPMRRPSYCAFKKSGTLEAGKIADIVAIRGNPLAPGDVSKCRFGHAGWRNSCAKQPGDIKFAIR